MITDLATNILLARRKKGLNQQQLADKIKVSRVVISFWETGRHKPNDENLKALGNELKGDEKYFI